MIFEDRWVVATVNTTKKYEEKVFNSLFTNYKMNNF